MASPRPKPSALNKLNNNPGKRPINDAEPKPSLEMPPCPADLPAHAKTVWDDLAPQLNKIGILTRIDGGAFARYCRLRHLCHLCEEFINTNGTDAVKYNDEGIAVGVMPFPHLKRYLELNATLLRLEQEFGLTPSSRVKLHALPADDDADELDEFTKPLKIAE